jgi:uncharacterized damage-inducible protein DinB
MVKLIKWFDRKFDFNFPVSLYSTIVARVAGTPARVEEIASLLNYEQLTKKINGEWSVQEHMGHLIILEELHLKRFEGYMQKAEKLTAADLTNRKTYESDYNNKDINEILKKFRKIRMNFVDKLDKVNEEVASRTALHPRLNQPMRLIDNVFFAAEHDDHHIAVIRRILSIK